MFLESTTAAAFAKSPGQWYRDGYGFQIAACQCASEAEIRIYNGSTSVILADNRRNSLKNTIASSIGVPLAPFSPRFARENRAVEQ